MSCNKIADNCINGYAKIWGRVVWTPAYLPVTLDRLLRPPNKEIFEYIQTYSTIFEVFFKNI
jgi:hypothetical protein